MNLFKGIYLEVPHLIFSILNNQIETKYVTLELINYQNIEQKNSSTKFDDFLKEDNVHNQFVGKIFVGLG